MAITRRKFLGMTAVTGASLMMPWKFGAQEAFAAQAVSPAVAKWAQALRGLGPTGIPVAAGVPDPVFPNTLMYDITVGQFTDQLHPAFGPTTLWGYWDSRQFLADGITPNPSFNVKHHLGGLIINTRGTATRLRMTNALPAAHIFPNDLTVQTIPPLATANNRTAVHLHGGAVPWISDGGPFDWWDPTGASGLSFLNGPSNTAFNNALTPMAAGQADYFYPNNQSTRLMWYHDHAYGITRLNAYAGVATGYPIFDVAQETALGNTVPTNALTNLGALIPLVFQDKKFVNAATILAQDPTWTGGLTTGSLWYAHIYDPREFKLMTKPPYLPPPIPSAIPEFFGDTMLVNGTVAPLLTVEAKRYRFLALNACNARFLNINLLEVVAPNVEISTAANTLLPVAPIPGPAMVQIGTEAGYLAKEVIHTNNKYFNPITKTGNMLLGCAERSDFIIDFTGLAGKTYMMYNDAPGPFPAGPATTDYFIGNNKNPAMAGVLPGQTIDTRNILKITVVPATTADPSVPFTGFPATMPREPFLVQYPNPIPPVGPIAPLAPPAGATVRNITLNEDFDTFGRLRQLVGTTTPAPPAAGAPKNAPVAYGLEYGAPATETPAAGGVEVWNIYNLTADTHPMHFHLVEVQILSRQLFTLTKGVFTLTPLTKRGPELDELGWKETCKMHPGEMITVCMKFDMPAVPFNVPFSTRPMGNPAVNGGVIAQANEYVWHCHILEHEEHDMMRPLVVTGVNPVTPITVTPATQSVGGLLGGPTLPYTVGSAVNFSVAPSDPLITVAITGNTFTATVPAGSLPGNVTLTVSDNTGRTPVVVQLLIN